MQTIKIRATKNWFPKRLSLQNFLTAWLFLFALVFFTPCCRQSLSALTFREPNFAARLVRADSGGMCGFVWGLAFKGNEQKVTKQQNRNNIQEGALKKELWPHNATRSLKSTKSKKGVRA